jgi:hypothetical protein
MRKLTAVRPAGSAVHDHGDNQDLRSAGLAVAPGRRLGLVRDVLFGAALRKSGIIDLRANHEPQCRLQLHRGRLQGRLPALDRVRPAREHG